MSKTKSNRWSWKTKHYRQVWETMQKVLNAETWETTLSDRKLSEAIRAAGTYTTANITRTVRELHGIEPHEARKVALFSKSRK